MQGLIEENIKLGCNKSTKFRPVTPNIIFKKKFKLFYFMKKNLHIRPAMYLHI